MLLLSSKFENLEDERQLTQGTALIDFRIGRGERIDEVLARFEMARMEAEGAGFNIPNFQILTLILFRAPGVGTSRAAQLLQPLNHQMPRTQREYDSLLERMRSYGHLAERSPGNIGGIFRGRDNNAGTFHASTSSSSAGPPATDIWGDPIDNPYEASA